MNTVRLGIRRDAPRCRGGNHIGTGIDSRGQKYGGQHTIDKQHHILERQRAEYGNHGRGPSPIPENADSVKNAAVLHIQRIGSKNTMHQAASGDGTGHAPGDDLPHRAPARYPGDEKSHERAETGPEQRIENCPVTGEGSARPGVEPEDHVGIVAQQLSEGVGKDIEQRNRGATEKTVGGQKQGNDDIDVAR